MASAQQIHKASSHLNDKQKAKVGKAIEEAKNLLANAKAGQEHELAKVAGAMHNNQDQNLKIHKTHNYLGNFLANPLETIPPHDSGAFVHQGAKVLGPQAGVVGSKAAIVYANPLLGGLGWLLAWSKPIVGSKETNKVYVEAGSLARLDKLEWSDIEKKLDASHTVSRYWDSDTGAEASAEITEHAADMALVGANFEVNKETPPQAN